MKTLRLAMLALAGCGGIVEDGRAEDVPAAFGDHIAPHDDEALDEDARDGGGPDGDARDGGGLDGDARDGGPHDVFIRDVLRRDVQGMDAAPPDGGVRDAGPRDIPVTDMERSDAALPTISRPGEVRAGSECHELIRRLGVRFSIAGATRGIVDPVTVTPPIEGVHYRYASWTAAERPLLMDCRLAVALVRLGRELRSRWGIDDVQHIGIYNYRTIAGSTRLSQHAFANAIDIGAFRGRDGTTYSVLTDFVMNGAPTCPPRATNARDRVLKEIACWMNSSRTFHIVLTPNYDSAHRNHYHVDLTTGSDFVRVERPGGVDPPHDPLTDWLIEDD